MLDLGKRIKYIGTNFGPKFIGLGGVIYGNKETLHCVWRDFAVRFDNGTEFAVYAKDMIPEIGE
jgi:hypothetical protein